MFCKNCGREIDQKTLKKLMEQKDGSVVCSKCRQPLDNAEMCGGFWGLIAASEEKEAAEADTVNMTVMLDENGKPVQMDPRMQNRSSSSIPDANLRMSANNYSSQNSRQTAGTMMNDPASYDSYDQKAPETRIRRSGARKDTELWITRAIAVLLAIALIISLITRCGKSDQPEDEMEKSTETAEDMQDDFDYTEDPSNESGKAQGAPDEEPEDTPEEEERQAEGTEKEEETEDQNVTGNTDTGAVEKEPSREPAAGTEPAAVLQPQKQYTTLKRTIEIDENGWNLQSKVEMSGDIGNNVIIRWDYKGKKNLPNEQISTNKGVKDEIVEKKYVSEETGSSKTLVVYAYKNGYLNNEKWVVDGEKSDLVSYKTLSNNEVREIYSLPREGLKPDGTQFKYKMVEKTYNKKPDGTVSNVLDKIDYYEDNKDESSVLHIDYTDDATDVDTKYQNEQYVSWNVYTVAESYKDENGPVSLKGNDYEYDQIRYTYGKVNGVGETRLLEMGYYFQGAHTKGPNGFSYFTCQYDDAESVRTDTFYDELGEPVPITAEDPFLSKAVIPAYYSEEFPYLTGRPGLDFDADEDIQKNMRDTGNADEGRSGPSNNQDSKSKDLFYNSFELPHESGGGAYGN